MPGSAGGQTWFLGIWDQPGAWLVDVGLGPAFTWASLVFESANMGLRSVSSWVRSRFWVLSYQLDARDHWVVSIFLV